MFRFTIRDVLWLTVVVALAVGWRVNRLSWSKHLLIEREERNTQIAKLRADRDAALDEVARLRKDLTQLQKASPDEN